jgi:hypothetical protein
MGKTEKLYRRVRKAKRVYFISERGIDTVPTLVEGKVKSGFYHGGAIHIWMKKKCSSSDYYSISNATKNIFTNKKEAIQAFKKRLKYRRWERVARINREKEVIQKIDNKLNKLGCLKKPVAKI